MANIDASWSYFASSHLRLGGNGLSNPLLYFSGDPGMIGDNNEGKCGPIGPVLLSDDDAVCSFDGAALLLFLFVPRICGPSQLSPVYNGIFGYVVLCCTLLINGVGVSVLIDL